MLFSFGNHHVTIMFSDFSNMMACLVNSTTVVGANILNGLLYKADTVKGKINFKKEDTYFKVCDSQIKWVLRLEPTTKTLT